MFDAVGVMVGVVVAVGVGVTVGVLVFVGVSFFWLDVSGCGWVWVGVDFGSQVF